MRSISTSSAQTFGGRARALVFAALALGGLALAPGSALAGASTDPTDLSTGNLLKNPGFNGTSCYADWSIETVEVACNAGSGYVWLNHNNRAGDPAVKQTLSGLTVGTEYEIIVGWRGGDHGPIHGVKGAQSVFAIDIDGKEIKRLSTGPNFTDWMVNDALDTAGKYNKISFRATATSHTIRFRGEVGADGDVLLSYAKVKAVVADPNSCGCYKLRDLCGPIGGKAESFPHYGLYCVVNGQSADAVSSLSYRMQDFPKDCEMFNKKLQSNLGALITQKGQQCSQ